MKCNLRCGHCAVFDNAFVSDQREVSSWQDIHDVLDAASNIGVRDIVLTGGEPTLSPWLVPALRQATRRGFSCSLSTNGTLVTPTLVAALVEAGLEKATVSLDGATARSHEALRGQRTFEATRSGICALVAGGVAVTIGAFIRTELVDEVPRLIRMCAELGAPRLTLLAPIYQGRCHSGDFPLESAFADSRSVFALGRDAGVNIRVMRPQCEASECPSGEQIFGAAGATVFPFCLYKGELRRHLDFVVSA